VFLVAIEPKADTECNRVERFGASGASTEADSNLPEIASVIHSSAPNR
jgi:hypothetical protein